MKTILLATDLSEYSDRALERAMELALENKATLHILHVIPDYKAKSLSKSLKADTESVIGKYVSEYKIAPKIKVKIHVAPLKEAIYTEILEQAHKIKAELIVMGLHRKAGLIDMFTGTTAERVARLGSFPVLMVKNKAIGPYRKILWPTDFSPAASAALRLAADLSPQAAFYAVHAFEIPVYAIETGVIYLETKAAVMEQDQKALNKWIEDETKAFSKKHKGQKLNLTGKLVHAPVLEAISKQAKNTKSECIAIGAHSRTGYAPALLGSLAGTLLSNPPADILVVRQK